ncbi:MAG: peptide/nickel transport system ATP-binding protein ddpF [Gaiellales bacterium]|nr:peptide/nickel transport system ATP-binding protein ddpF [Gaiellales bacterium]
MSGRLDVSGLSVALDTGERIVDDVSFGVPEGEILGLVGESGSGKTTVALALLGFARRGAGIVAGTVDVDGRRIAGPGAAAGGGARGRVISYVPQDPGGSLNPSLRIGDSVADMIRAHIGGDDVRSRVQEAFAAVNLPCDDAFARRFPHELSGGQQQRVAIAIALVCRPAVVVLDEPTTGLDVITQSRILAEVDRLRREASVTIVYVSHDLAVVGSVADRVAVMYAGRIVESGPSSDVLFRPRHPYTVGLLSSIPDPVTPRQLRSMPGIAVGPRDRPPGCAFAPRCTQRVPACDQLPGLFQASAEHVVRCFEWTRTPQLDRPKRTVAAAEAAEAPLLEVRALQADYHGRRVVKEVSFAVHPRECLALVGESGSGKTTIARTIAGLHARAGGDIALAGASLAPFAAGRTREQRRRIQIVFQNPYDSLNPRHRVLDAVARPIRVLRGMSRADAATEALALIDQVRLPRDVAERYPGELSGGERQRVAIARALGAQPDLLVCDEITSALDVSVQAAVLELLAELRRALGLAMLFITHDLGVVASIAARVLVLENGELREQGQVNAVLSSPGDDYTRRLVAAAPRLPEHSDIHTGATQ